MSNLSGTGKTAFKNRNIAVLEIIKNFRNTKEVNK